MKENKNNLLVIYLNEFNYRYLLNGAKKYNCRSILKILKLKKLKTYTKDDKQDFNLDPWVQSVSINTGKPSRQHKVLKLGQPIKKDLVQIWDKLSKNKISCSVWGTMNSKFKKNKYLDYYFPDPWNFRDKVWPKKLMGLNYLPNYYAKNYLKFNFFKVFYYLITFLSTLIFNVKLTGLFKDFIFSFYLFIRKGIKNFILFFLYDLIFLHLFKFSINKKKSSFSMIFLNSIAHYQHNNWNELENERYFFIFVEKIFSNILILKKEFCSTIIFNGFTQKKISTEYLIRPKEPKIFLSKFIKFKKLEQDMTNGGFIFFNSKKEKYDAIKILNEIYYSNKKVFNVKIYKDNSIFYKINLKSKKFLNKKNYDNQSLIEMSKEPKNSLKKKNISSAFLKNVNFIKSTGAHVANGLILHENFDFFTNKKLIENHKIFNYICKYFHI
mgnify:CR=1 FL=1